MDHQLSQIPFPFACQRWRDRRTCYTCGDESAVFTLAVGDGANDGTSVERGGRAVLTRCRLLF